MTTRVLTFAPANVSACAERNLSAISTSLSPIRSPLAHPVRDRRIHLVELAHEKMVGVLHNNDFVFARQRSNHHLQFVHCAVNVIRAMHEKLRFFTPRQIRKIRIVDWRSQPDQRSDSLIFAANAKSHPAPETESGNEKRNIWKFGSEKFQRRTNIAAFPFAAIVFSFAHSRSAKIETQHWKSKRIQRFRSLIDHFVVHRAAKERMRVANDRSHRRRTHARAPQNSFQTPCRSCEKEIARFVLCAHKSRQKKCECTATRRKVRTRGRDATIFLID